MKLSTCLTFVFALWSAAFFARAQQPAAAPAQAILNLTLKDGRVVQAAAVERSGDNIMVTPPPAAGASGAATAKLGYPIASIAKVDFPEPAQLRTATDLLSRGRAAEAFA